MFERVMSRIGARAGRMSPRLLSEYSDAVDHAAEDEPSAPQSGAVDPPANSDSPALPALRFASPAFDKRAGKYLLRTEGGSLLVELRKATGTIDPRVGMVGPASIISFANQRLGMLNVVVLDLDGDGIELKSRKKADARFDMDGDGIRDDTGWVGKSDGILVIDRNGDQRIDGPSELTFVTDVADAMSGLHGLSSFDTNRDGQVDAVDARFGELKLWVDRNGDGTAGEGEVRSLADHGIKSIVLDPVATSTTLKLGANAVTMTATFERTDGRTGTIGDAMLAFSPSATSGKSLESGDSDDTGSASDWEGFADTWTPKANVGSRAAAPPATWNGGWVEKSRGGTADQAALLPQAAPRGPGSASQNDLDYTFRIEAANGRLIQALGAFGASSSAAHHMYHTAPPAQQDWLTVASLPSVQNMVSMQGSGGI